MFLPRFLDERKISTIFVLRTCCGVAYTHVNNYGTFQKTVKLHCDFNSISCLFVQVQPVCHLLLFIISSVMHVF